MLKKSYILIGLILFAGCNGKVENSTNSRGKLDAKLDDFVENMITDYTIGGAIGIGVVKDGEVLVEKALGYSDYNEKIPATTATPFYIASITKSFMGTLATILHENGEIDIEESLDALLPFELSKEIDISEKLLEDLFTHTAGIGNSAVAIKTAYTGNFTKAEIIDDLEKLSYPVTPGYRYTNLGYLLAAIIFEEKLGSSWKDLLQTRIFDPIEMTNSSANVSTYADDEIAKPHTLFNGKIKVGSFLKKDDTMHAAGGLFTTVEDMNKWMIFHLLRNNSLLSEESFQYIHSDLVGYYGKSGSFNNYGYGMGWNQADWNEYEISWHGGGYPGYRSLCILVPEENLGITILMNQATPAMNLLTDFLLGNFLEVPDFDSYFASRKSQVADRWNRYQFIRDSTLEAGTKKVDSTRELEDYEGAYLNEEFGELLVKPDGNTLNIFMGNLSFITNYIGDDRFFFFNDADQLYGSVDFYFHHPSNQQASSLDFSGVEYKKVSKTDLKR